MGAAVTAAPVFVLGLRHLCHMAVQEGICLPCQMKASILDVIRRGLFITDRFQLAFHNGRSAESEPDPACRNACSHTERHRPLRHIIAIVRRTGLRLFEKLTA